MPEISPRLYLVTPVIVDPAAIRDGLEEACGASEIAAVLLRLASADERTLVNRIKTLAPIVQAHGAAAIVADPVGTQVETDLAAVVLRSGADGAQAEAPERLGELCRRFKDDRDVGAGGLRTKHDAMVAGEIGVDYVMFGEPRPDGFLPALDLVVERAEWWAEIFQTPCAVFAPSLGDVPRLAATGADFIALGDAVWSHPDGAGAAVAAAHRAIHRKRAEAS